MGLRSELAIRSRVSDAFKKYSIEHPDIEKAVSDAILAVLTDRTVISELTQVITEIQNFERDRRNRFRG